MYCHITYLTGEPRTRASCGHGRAADTGELRTFAKTILVRNRLHMHRRRADRNDKVKLSYNIVDKELGRALSC
jgi:hypothetical protein